MLCCVDTHTDIKGNFYDNDAVMIHTTYVDNATPVDASSDALT